MSDVLDIQSQCCSEFEDESDGLTFAVKGMSKIRKGRGFHDRSGGEVAKIQSFDKLNSEDNQHEDHVRPQSSVEGWVLILTGIHEEATDDDIKELFEEFGSIKNLILNLDRRTGYIKGYALLEYATYEEAFHAKEALNGYLLLGKTIKVNWSFTKGPNPVTRKRMTSKRTSYIKKY